jgi:hypothetical protein
MAQEITNSLRSASIIRYTGAGTSTIQLANLSSNVSVETVNSASIKRVMWTTNGSITIARNGEVLLELFGGGDMRFSEIGHVVSKNQTSAIVITVTSGGTVVMEVTKDTTYNTPLVGI